MVAKSRVFLVVLDSVGIGGAPDAARFGDEGSNTVGHIAAELETSPKKYGATRPISLPNLNKLGLGKAVALASGLKLSSLDTHEIIGQYGAATETSVGKDTPTGHWEIAGVPLPWQWHVFPDTIPAFPAALLDEIYEATGERFIGLKHASGTEIIDELGEEHVKTGHAIAYTSVDSVFQIAAHEEIIPLPRLYEICEAVAKVVHPTRVGRVIARPFIGESGAFQRTVNRKDFAMSPPGETILDKLAAHDVRVVSIGKIGDIFAHRATGIEIKGSDATLFDALLNEVKTAPAPSFVFANFVEFDTKYGHRRDVIGYARALEWFDEKLGELLPELRDDDVLMITADHGNDPTWTGTDHTRERVPFLLYSPKLPAAEIGLCRFSDIGASAIAPFGIGPSAHGENKIKTRSEA